jgi:hypothetical protein
MPVTDIKAGLVERSACVRLAHSLALAALFAATPASADEGGVSFWLPGQYASFAAAPGEPGWSLPLFYYHASVDAGGEKSFSRGGRITAGLDARADMVFAVPSYTFATPVWGAQASVGVGLAVARMKASVNGTLTGPFGRTLAAGSTSDTTKGVSDLYPNASLKWNRGVHNYMVYAMADAPVGSYETGRLANIGINHWAYDMGGAYTYLDPKAGHEFSATLGFTYNWKNHDTNYRNGIDSHLDWAASQFISAQTHIGLVGYFYDQLTGDSGGGATLGSFKSRVSAIGPQMGHFFVVGEKKWYVNLKAYYEFDASNRPEGWNAWVTLAIPLGGK